MDGILSKWKFRLIIMIIIIIIALLGPSSTWKFFENGQVIRCIIDPAQKKTEKVRTRELDQKKFGMHLNVDLKSPSPRREIFSANGKSISSNFNLNDAR